jgi:hypothetical protein
MVERCVLPREIVGLGVGRRRRGDQADMRCRHGQRAERRDRLQPSASDMRHIAVEGQLIGQEDGIEEACFRLPRQLLIVADVRQRERGRRGVPPRGFVMAAALDEQIEMQLAFHRSTILKTCSGGNCHAEPSNRIANVAGAACRG